MSADSGQPEGGSLIGRAVQLSSLVAYQEGSVVSRTVIDKPTGTITLFAFARGEGLSEHTTPYDAIVQVLDGRAAITVSGQEHQVGTGEMLIMPADEPHALRAVEAFKMMLVMIR
jgi:quercetin dioxygenase-like cupin family protein